jgi:hypothetical protein
LPGAHRFILSALWVVAANGGRDDAFFGSGRIPMVCVFTQGSSLLDLIQQKKAHLSPHHWAPAVTTMSCVA